MPGMSAFWIDHPPTPSQKRWAPSTSWAGNSTCTTFLPISNPPFVGPVKLYAHASTTREKRWFARSCCTTRSRRRRATSVMPSCAGRFRAERSGTDGSSARPWEIRHTGTTPSGNGRTWTPSRRRRTARSSWRPARTRWRWAAASRSCSRNLPEPTHPRALAPEELGFESIVYGKAPPRATITLNRPDVLNAFDFRMLRELMRACEDASWDDDVRVVVVTGAGRAFCVGADLKSWSADYLGEPREYWKWFGAFKDAHDKLREIGKPTLARINGIAVGGGNELQMACDLAVMVDDAFIRHVGLEHGSVPAGGATQWLPVFVGDRRARGIIYMCEEIPAAQAAEWGLVKWVVPAAELDAKVDEVVDKLAKKLPQTTRYAKQQLNFWRDLSWHETVNHARDWLALSMLGDEAQEAVKGFLNRSEK